MTGESSSPAMETTYLGLKLNGPVIASSGPLTRTVDSMLELQKAGASAVVLPSLFEEEVVAEEMQFFEAYEQGAGIDAEFTGILPDVDMPDLGPERHVRHLAEAKKALDIPVIASVNATHTGSWERYATMMQDAGADAIELNLYAVAADPKLSAADVEQQYLDVVREVRAAVKVPLAVKLSPFFSSFANFAAQVAEAGAESLVLFNRFYAPDLDLDTLGVVPKVALSHPTEQRLPLRWLGILRSQLPDLDLACTGGVHSERGVLKALLVGANVACTTAAVLERGPVAITAMLDGVRSWMTEREYDSVEQLRGSVSASNTKDPGAFERSQYLAIITS